MGAGLTVGETWGLSKLTHIKGTDIMRTRTDTQNLHGTEADNMTLCQVVGHSL